jgi:hypothetical protein
VDRLHGLGNAVVPQIPELIGRAILEARAPQPRDRLNTHSGGPATIPDGEGSSADSCEAVR